MGNDGAFNGWVSGYEDTKWHGIKGKSDFMNHVCARCRRMKGIREYHGVDKISGDQD
jgi:hypothetical protein